MKKKRGGKKILTIPLVDIMEAEKKKKTSTRKRAAHDDLNAKKKKQQKSQFDGNQYADVLPSLDVSIFRFHFCIHTHLATLK